MKYPHSAMKIKVGACGRPEKPARLPQPSLEKAIGIEDELQAVLCSAKFEELVANSFWNEQRRKYHAELWNLMKMRDSLLRSTSKFEYADSRSTERC